jgi:hypothetical protein
VLTLLAGSGLVLYLRRPHGRGPIRASPPPVVFMPQRHEDDVLPPRPVLAEAAPGARGAQAGGPQLVEIPVARTVTPAADGAPWLTAEAGSPTAFDSRVGSRRRRGGRVAATEEATATSAAATGTLRMLPGRLEVVEGHPTDREIRFVAEPGLADQRFTMGRGEGPPNQHVCLQGQTVSRLHAALTYHDGGWGIENLSSTNPLRVNGQAVDAADTMVPLTDGDLIELGEVVLRFRA